jgi:hypothetical protein
MTRSWFNRIFKRSGSAGEHELAQLIQDVESMLNPSADQNTQDVAKEKLQHFIE